MNQQYLQAASSMTAADYPVLQQQLTGNIPDKATTPGDKQKVRTTRDRERILTSGITDSPALTTSSRINPEAVRLSDNVIATEPGAVAAATEAGNPIRKRQYQQHDWPLVGAVLTAEYYGQQYRAVVIPAQKKLMSGRQLMIESGAAAGTICDSLSAAMILATEEQRQKQGLRRKGVANGWDFWQWEGK